MDCGGDQLWISFGGHHIGRNRQEGAVQFWHQRIGIAVSYTHLDVYKRQAPNNASTVAIVMDTAEI